MIKDPIIHSIRRSQYFSHDEKLAVVIICRKYDKLRTLPDKMNFADLDNVLEDKEVVLNHLKAF